MERIIYRKTLDVHKSGVQFTLQGFQTADNMSRTIELSLMASGDTIDLPLEQLMAVMYVTTPNATEPSVNECTIKDNSIVCDILPIVEEGITEVQLKLIDTRLEGAIGVLPTPKFAIEVSKSNTDDGSATQNTTFTALETALAKAKGVYDARLIRIELDTDCTFRAIYADGTIYQSDVLKELFLKGDVLLSQSYARGGTGVRKGEDTDNSLYYSNVSKSASEEAQRISGEATELLTEVTKHGVYTAFIINFETGEVEYVSPSYTFNIDEETGELKANGQAYTFEEDIHLIVTEWLAARGVSLEDMQSDIQALQQSDYGHSENIRTLQHALDDIERQVVKLVNANPHGAVLAENLETIHNPNEGCGEYHISKLSDYSMIAVTIHLTFADGELDSKGFDVSSPILCFKNDSKDLWKGTIIGELTKYGNYTEYIPMSGELRIGYDDNTDIVSSVNVFMYGGYDDYTVNSIRIDKIVGIY